MGEVMIMSSRQKSGSSRIIMLSLFLYMTDIEVIPTRRNALKRLHVFCRGHYRGAVLAMVSAWSGYHETVLFHITKRHTCLF